jgi:hypothetical protein
VRTSRILAAPALLIALLLAAGPARAAAGGPRWISDDYPRALAEAKARGVPIFVDAWAPW